MITKFSVKNYKCLADVSLPLTKLHVIIGQNDTGKTSLLEAIYAGVHLLKNTYGSRQPITEPFPRERLGSELVWKTALNQPVEFCYESISDSADKLFARSFAASVTFDCDSYSPTFKVDNFDSAEHVTKPNIDKKMIDMQLGVSVFRFRPRMMARSSALSIKPRYTLDEDGFGLPTLLSELQDYDYRIIEKIMASFRVYFPQYIRIRLENTQGWIRSYHDNGMTNDMVGGPIGKQVWLATSQGEVRLQHVSDGVVLLLGILALQNAPFADKLLMIEEPENGVHPSRMIEIAKMLRHLSQREQNAPQIILTTHSPLLLSEFKPEEVTLMRREKDGSAKAYPLRNAEHIHERMQDKSQLGELWYYLSEDELLL